MWVYKENLKSRREGDQNNKKKGHTLYIFICLENVMRFTNKKYLEIDKKQKIKIR